jgi:hypothetical protein
MVRRDALHIFREYLQSLPDELLESVAEDYVWLAGLALKSRATDFAGRRECCREECARRGDPRLYDLAASIVSPHAA